MADIAVTRFALTTAAASSTQDVTISGFGTPSAVLFLYSGGTSDGTVANHNRVGIGATDGTTQAATIVRAADAQGTATVRRLYSSSNSIIGLQNTGNAILGEVGFSTWITDGVRLVVNSAFSSSFLVTAVFFSSNVEAKVISHDLGTSTSAQDITTVGFEPDAVIAFSNASGQVGNTCSQTFGVAVNDGTDTQRSVSWRNRDTVSTMQLSSLVSDSKILSSLHVTSDSERYGVTLSDFDADGFSLTSSASAGSDYAGLLAIKLPTGQQFSLFDSTVPASGSIAETSPGFLPYFGLMSNLAGPTAENTLDTTSGAAPSFSAFDENSIYTISTSSLDASADSLEKSLSDDSFTLLRASDGTVETTSSGYAFDSQGWDITLTANPAAAVLGWGLAIGDASVAGAGIRNPMFGPMTLRNPLGRFN